MKSAGKHRKLNNAGSAIVTILVVVAFLTILATVMLYISGANFQMKVTDYRTKESFYQAETPVEELRAQLVKDTQDAFAYAYTAAMSEYSGMGDAATREANYRQLFCDKMNEIWKTRSGYIPDTTNLNWVVGIGEVLRTAAGGGTWSAEAVTGAAGGWRGSMTLAGGGVWRVEVSPAAKWDDSVATSQGQLILRGVTFTYDSPERYTSIISTDYCVTIPQVSWSDTFDPMSTPAPAATPMPGATAAPSPAPADSRLDFSGCVNYMNWTKR